MRCLFMIAVWAVAALAAVAGTPPPPCVMPAGMLSPLLFVRFAGTPGLQCTIFQAEGPTPAFGTTTAFGLRPGYIYQVQLTGLPDRLDRPDAVTALYPTLEVVGALAMAPGRSAANFPVPVVLTKEDIAKAQDGSLITKVIYLECPDQSLGTPTPPDLPVELDLVPGGDPWAEARARGRIMVVVRFGERQMTGEELRREFIPGTILVPGEKVLPPPAQPPYRPWECFRVYDPVLGPKPYTEEECLRDGGDCGLPAGIGPDGRLHGLDPADTVAEFTDSLGRRHVRPSNCVCIYAPRFAVARLDTTPVGYTAVTGISGQQTVVAQVVAKNQLSSVDTWQAEQPEAVRGRDKASGIRATEGLVTVDQFDGLATAVGRVKGADVVGTCQKQPLAPDRPLVLCKEADKYTARLGDVITFTLKYSNVGGQPITDIAVSDSLTNRLEYIPGSARAERDAVFTTRENESGSLVLRWQFSGQLLPRESGRVTFQARVR